MKRLAEMLEAIGTSTDGATPHELALPTDLIAAISAASFVERQSGGSIDAPDYRFAVMASGFGGYFIYDDQEVEKRIRKHFPYLSEGQVQRACNYFHSHFVVFLKQRNEVSLPKSSWALGWNNRREHQA